MKITVFIKKPDLTFIVLELEALYTGGQSKRIHTYVLASKHAHTHTLQPTLLHLSHISLSHTHSGSTRGLINPGVYCSASVPLL